MDWILPILLSAFIKINYLKNEKKIPVHFLRFSSKVSHALAMASLLPNYSEVNSSPKFLMYKLFFNYSLSLLNLEITTF